LTFTVTVMSSLKALLLLYGLSCALVDEELAVCERGEIEEARNMSSYHCENTQMRSTVRNVMLHLDLLGKNPVTEGVERQFGLKLSGEDLLKLQQYVDGGPAVVDVQSILVESLQIKNIGLEKLGVSPESSGSDLPKNYLDADHFSFVFIFQCLVLPCCLLLRFKLQWGWGRILLLVCSLAVLQNWVHLYQEACALKYATLAKNVKGCQGHLDEQGWFSTVTDFLGGLFNGVEDPCEEYYLALLVDPAWEIGLQDAFVDTLSVFLVAPGSAFGESLAGFYSQLLEPLPLLWQLPIIGLATHLLVVLLLLVFGYEISTPLLSIRPAIQELAL